VEAKGLRVFARIDHGAGARSAGLSLAPTELVLFGSPAIGTRLMQCGHTVAIDLPLKALIWQGEDGKVRLAYTDAPVLARRHGLGGCEEALQNVSAALASFAAAATR
jgi:uncharacterized protein (DUF302 family)